MEKSAGKNQLDTKNNGREGRGHSQSDIKTL
jgi:hypothetical protein